jgi:phosphotransferase system enzyme I (PtsI)
MNVLKSQIENEVKRLLVSLDATKNELQELQKKVLDTTGKEKADFFNLHLLIIEDETFIEKISHFIRSRQQNAEWAISDFIEEYAGKLTTIDDQYIRERAADVYDIGKRILRHLLKKEKTASREYKPDTILVAADLAPSETATLDLTRIRGFVTDGGGETSHTAILARALNIPAIVGATTATSLIVNGDLVIVDSNTGHVLVNPEEKTLAIYRTAKRIYEKFQHSLERLTHLDAVTKDGKRISIVGNIEIPEEADAILKNGGMGIGLYRTEYFYLNRDTLPTEDELFRIFKDVAQKMKPLPVVFRTLDIGGDKIAAKLMDGRRDANPFLGWRAIRFCLENIDIFSTQLRAMLRASAFGKVRIMLPMIADISEVVKTKKLLERIKQDLLDEKIAFDPKIEIGAMIEIPSAVLMAHLLAAEVSFFSVGSNDLVQYTMAVDRTNPKVAYLFDPFHPSVLKLLKMTVDTARRFSIKVSICGELGSEPRAIPLLLGLGFDELSVSPSAIPEVKKVVRALNMEECRKTAARVLEIENTAEIHKYLEKVLRQAAPDVLKKIAERNERS